MRLTVEPYLTQVQKWPKKGRQILAQFDEKSVVVYQAYHPEIGNFAVNYSYFGGEFSLNRMSWIKPNFLWMMYHSGWGTKPDQEVILAVSIKRSAFDEILSMAVNSKFCPDLYSDQTQWKAALSESFVRLQWDPDHHPKGNKLERRAIQLELRGKVLFQYSKDWIVHIEDISDFVKQQYSWVKKNDWTQLLTPYERIYPVTNLETAKKLGLSVS